MSERATKKTGPRASPRFLYPRGRNDGMTLDEARSLTPPPRKPKSDAGQTVGWPLAPWLSGQGAGGKSGLHGNTVPGNARRGRPQGKCNRKQTARAVLASARVGRVRVKGCGKSAPRPQRWGRHCKPHREQDRIGTAGHIPKGMMTGGFSRRRPGRSREAVGNSRPRGMAIHPTLPRRCRRTEPGL